MNRDDLLKKCVDRGVADETSIGAVSHLFYVYLLSALQKGQRVEVPNFGTFGTRVVGVKRARKMPFFEAERELAEKVNERYKNLKYLVIGKYELIPTLGEEEYRGKEAPYDVLTEQVGKEMVLDTYREVTIDEYERELAAQEGPTPPKEKTLMPKLNLREDEGMEERLEPELGPAPPTLRDVGGGRGPSALLQVMLVVVILGALTYALNYFGVIHLWGKKAPTPVVTSLPEPEPEPEPPVVEPTPTPTPTPTPPVAEEPKPTVEKPKPPVEKPKPVLPSSTGGRFTVQVSSWITNAKAEEEVARLSAMGLEAFVEAGVVDGVTRHRVRVGRYGLLKDAEVAAARLSEMLENGFWVARVRAQ